MMARFKHETRNAALLAATLALSAPIGAGPVNIAGGFGSFNPQARSLRELRWDTVVRQKYDFSCGSAAVATLLTHHYDRPTGEEAVFQAMYASGNQARIRAEGFSMLDMKHFLDQQGLKADGFRVTLDQFIRIGVPAITLINTKGYRHFVVVKGVDRNKVLLGDPAVGNAVVSREEFERLWTGTVLAAREQTAVARAHFNSAEDWRVRPKAPIGQGVNRASVGMTWLTLPGINELGK